MQTRLDVLDSQYNVIIPRGQRVTVADVIRIHEEFGIYSVVCDTAIMYFDEDDLISVTVH